MKNTRDQLGRGDKILLFLYEHSNGEQAKVRYEDIVVGLFKKFPHDFHLKGYPEHPDSGDLIHKPLYDFKKKGYLNAVNKIFSLTERGIDYAKSLQRGENATPSSNDRLSRTAETEVARAKSLEGFALFLQGERDNLSDNDLYNYLGVTVRTQRNAFIGRLETMKAVIAELEAHTSDPVLNALRDYHNFLVNKHQSVIDYFIKGN
ncbi:MAG: Uncharacterized protein Athens041674_735 [Parcubacteria group bacterium Athens0416_74]|nr:MAG: Uncharacterized protein Athens041674_735 [Parcubacteria group bacterium Athens0416_74]